MSQTDHLEAFDDPESPDTDFASEHEDSTVDPDISSGRDDAETESPDGWAGMDDRPTPP